MKTLAERYKTVKPNTINIDKFFIVKEYLKAWRLARKAADKVSELKPLFAGSCDVLAGVDNEQISIDNALIYKVKRVSWDYSQGTLGNNIRAFEEQLNDLKAIYETEHKPIVSYHWAGKESK